MLYKGRPQRRTRRLPHWHWHAYNRYFGADYDGHHLYQCRCGNVQEGI
jgi:hypothetical protein